MIALAETYGGDYDDPSAIQLWIDPGNASKETIQQVIEAVSDLHVAAGGQGLLFEVVNNDLPVEIIARSA